MGKSEKAADSDKLDGSDSTAFLGAGATAADSAKLGGLPATDYLRSDAKAADADRLDGHDASEFLGPGGKASDSDLLDGQDSRDFAFVAGIVDRSGEVRKRRGSFSVENISPGTYEIRFGARQVSRRIRLPNRHHRHAGGRLAVLGDEPSRVLPAADPRRW